MGGVTVTRDVPVTKEADVRVMVDTGPFFNFFFFFDPVDVYEDIHIMKMYTSIRSKK
jgi:hypothetical protein